MEKVDWLVRFSDGEHWFKPFLKSGFGHCSLIREYGPLWLLVDPALNYTQLQVLLRADHELVDLVGDDVVVGYSGYPNPQYRFPGPFSCVEVVKSFLGIAGPIFTPYQLWRYLGQNT